MASWTLLLPVYGLLTVAVASVPQLPRVYHVTGTIYLPKAEVVEPFEAWVDIDRMSRIDYYHGKCYLSCLSRHKYYIWSRDRGKSRDVFSCL